MGFSPRLLDIKMGVHAQAQARGTSTSTIHEHFDSPSQPAVPTETKCEEGVCVQTVVFPLTGIFD